MKNILLRRSLVFGITILFLALCFNTGTSVNNEKASDQLKKEVPTIFSAKAGELAWWKFDEGSGTTVGDSSGHGYHGNINGGATWGSGGLVFDGTDDYVEFDAHSEGLGINKTDDYLISSKFKTSGSGMIYSMSHTDPARAYLDLFIGGDGKIKVEMGDETCLFDVSSSSSYNDNDWHTVEMRFFGNPTDPTLDIYVDGSKDGTATKWLCPMLDEDFKTAKIGCKSDGASDFYDGEIGETKIYKNLNFPPSDPNIAGKKTGTAGTPYEYQFTSTDPEGGTVSYQIEWGDGGTTSWTTPQASGTPYKETHTFAEEKSYTIRAQARDSDGATSGWKEYVVTMPRNKAVEFNSLLLRFLEQHSNLFPIIKFILGL